MKYLIVGLGNIGKEYEITRHNIGFKIADNISEKIESEFELKKHAFYAYGKFKGKNIQPERILEDENCTFEVCPAVCFDTLFSCSSSCGAICTNRFASFFVKLSNNLVEEAFANVSIGVSFFSSPFV